MKFLFCEGKDKQTNVIAKKTAGKASEKDGKTTKHGTAFISGKSKVFTRRRSYSCSGQLLTVADLIKSH